MECKEAASRSRRRPHHTKCSWIQQGLLAGCRIGRRDRILLPLVALDDNVDVAGERGERSDRSQRGRKQDGRRRAAYADGEREFHDRPPIFLDEDPPGVPLLDDLAHAIDELVALDLDLFEGFFGLLSGAVQFGLCHIESWLGGGGSISTISDIEEVGSVGGRSEDERHNWPCERCDLRSPFAHLPNGLPPEQAPELRGGINPVPVESTKGITDRNDFWRSRGLRLVYLISPPSKNSSLL